jgi:hypothetical protein
MDEQNDRIVPKAKNRAHSFMRLLMWQGSAGSHVRLCGQDTQNAKKKAVDELVDQ